MAALWWRESLGGWKLSESRHYDRLPVLITMGSPAHASSTSTMRCKADMPELAGTDTSDKLSLQSNRLPTAGIAPIGNVCQRFDTLIDCFQDANQCEHGRDGTT